MDFINFKVNVDPNVRLLNDLIKREVMVTVGGAKLIVKTIEKTSTEVGGFDGVSGARVQVVIVDINSSGIRQTFPLDSFTLDKDMTTIAGATTSITKTGETQKHVNKAGPA